MVWNAILAVLALLVCVSKGAPPTSSQYICSSFCKQTGCTGFSSADCDNNCNTASGGNTWGWNPSGGPCEVTTPGILFLDSSEDAGGTITVSPNTFTSNCDALETYSGATAYGDYLATEPVTITLAGGTDIPHYRVDLIFDVVLADPNSDDSDKRWDNTRKMTATIDTSPAISKSITLGSSVTNYKGYCGDNNKQDNFYQYKQPFLHNLTNTNIVFTITTDNTKTEATWVAKEFIMTIHTCHVGCLSCYNNASNEYACFSCDPSLGYMLNNNSCYNVCRTGFGYTEDPAICVWCDLNCTSCSGVYDNCSACVTNNNSPYKSSLFYEENYGYYICVNDCGDGYFVNTSINTCQLCDPTCLTCSINETYCYSCRDTYGWTGHYCYNPCPTSPIAYYFSNNNTNCTQCNLTCIACTDRYVCSSCTLTGSHTAYYLDGLCYNTTCPDPYYADTNYGVGPNICIRCADACAKCTGRPSPCQVCNSGNYFYNFTCGPTCPDGFIAYSLLNECLDCSIYCVDLTINPYFPDALYEKLYVDMTFTKNLDFTTFDIAAFQTVSIEGIQSGEYTVSYQQLTNSSYRIIIEPTGYIFLYNQTVTVTTKTQPAVLDTANDSMPFKPSAYSKTGSISWFLLKSPSMTEGEKEVISNIASINSISAAATTAPFVAELKKSGLFAMLFSGAQITTATVFVNSIPSQNMYEAVRFWGIFVLYDVPPWEQNSKIPNNVMGKETSSLVKDQRLLFDMTTTYWRYQRTGQSSFFLYDVYIPLLLIGLCWALALIAYLMRRCDKNALKAFESKYFTVLHKLHEAAILYVTTAMMLEWIYFDAGSGERWISLLICLGFTLYFVGYELYVYYDMIKYPEAFIGNAKYEYYLNRYGSFLKNLRFEEYDLNEDWSPKHWFRPYNYHILSYYKKFCMIMSLPLFYDLNHCQPAVLIILQALELARFLLTKPYYATWRNVYRFFLELFLLLFFTCVFVNTYIIDEIILNDPNTLELYVRIYYGIGWAGFALVFAFNIGFLVLLLIDTARGFKYSNRELLEEARRVYYYGKISAYERENEQVPLGLMNRWVKLGNLNKRNIEELPDINVRVEYFKLVKHNEYFDVEVFKAVELFMNTDLNYHRENNTTAGRKIRRKIKLSRETSKPIFALMCDVFKKYARKDTEAIVIKTFVHIAQSQFHPGDRIPLLPAEMFQKIELENFTGEKEHIKLKEKLKGFPLNAFDLENI